MTEPTEPFEPGAATDAMAAQLAGPGGGGALAAAHKLLACLCSVRAFPEAGRLAEAIRRHDPKHVRTRRLYGQAMIENGRATAAIDLLRVLRDDLESGDPERAEVVGLIGRAFKEMYFDAAAGDEARAGKALHRAMTAYRETYDRNPAVNTWQGVNLLGLAAQAVAGQQDPAARTEVERVAREILSNIAAVPETERGPWHAASEAMARLAIDDWAGAQEKFGVFMSSEETSAFQIGGTIRELLRTWNIEEREGGHDLLAALNVKLAAKPDGSADLSAAAVRNEIARLHTMTDAKDGPQLEAVLGTEGTKTYQWWKNGMERAQAVASVRDSIDGRRFGTAFLTTADGFGLGTAKEQIVVTNFHVVNEKGEFTDRGSRQRALKPEEARVVFEAVDNTQYEVAEILWCSDNHRHDVTLLRLTERVGNVRPLKTVSQLPLRAEELNDGTKPSVYVIGYPGGRDLAFSFQDNELLDHEGPDLGRPQIEGVCRVHYRAPTEGGSSGSPVFNYGQWEVIAVHHKGGRSGMPRLNGVAGEYGANEAISVACIADAIRAERSAQG